MVRLCARSVERILIFLFGIPSEKGTVSVCVMSCNATRKTLGSVFLSATNGFTFGLFLEWFKVAPKEDRLEYFHDTDLS